MDSNKKAVLVGCMLCMAAAAFADSPPFYAYTVSAGGGIPSGGGIRPAPRRGVPARPRLVTSPGSQSDCYSSDGTIPAFVQALGDSATLGLTSCSTGSSFNLPVNVSVEGISGSSTVQGNTSGISVSLNLSPVPPYSEGFAEVIYVQQFYSSPGATMLNFTYQVTGHTGLAAVTISSDCPADVSDCSPYSVSAVDLSPPSPIMLGPLTIGDSGMFTIFALVTEDVNEFTAYNPPLDIGLNVSCGFSVQVTGNGKEQIIAYANSLGGVDLQTAATACGYQGFDWQQTIVALPCPNGDQPAAPVGSGAPGYLPPANYCPGGALTAGPQSDGSSAPPFSDPVAGGYTYLRVTAPGEPSYDPLGPYNPYPFYWTPATAEKSGATLPTFSIPGGGFAVNRGNQLVFTDAPANPCLPTGPVPASVASNLAAERARNCGNPPTLAPSGSVLSFVTSLVGIYSDNTPSAPLFRFAWISNFNGTVGGYSVIGSIGPPDPNSGVGNVTITSINGVAVPPIIPPTQLTTTGSGLAYSRVTKTFDGTVTVTNTSATTLTTPTSFQLVLNSLPSGVTLVNSMGTFNNCPYITIPSITSLAAGQSVTVAVQFSNPSNATINLTPEFYAGSFQ